jgi:hypothetical protein
VGITGQRQLEPAGSHPVKAVDGYGSGVAPQTAANEPGDPSDTPLVAYANERVADDEAATERVEVEWAATSWTSLLSSSGGPLELSMVDGSRVSGPLVDTGDSWGLVAVGDQFVLVRLQHVTSEAGATSVVPRAGRSSRGVGWVFRRWARMRSAVSVQLVSADRLHGTVGQVLADAVQLVVDQESPRRVLIPTAAIVCASGDPFSD